MLLGTSASRRLRLGIATLLASTVLVVCGQSIAHRQNIWASIPQNNPTLVSTDPQGIYSKDPQDPWNRIFQLLFTRNIKVRMSSDFPEAAPFTTLNGQGFPDAPNSQVSTRSFERLEIGDRAIEPLYPSFLTHVGVMKVLTEPGYSNLKRGLTDALNEKVERTPLARALMQSDLWAAYDAVYRAYVDAGQDGHEFDDNKGKLLSLLGALIKKVALTPAEISALPHNASALPNSHHAPDFFAPGSGWIEVEYMPKREHDEVVQFRRAARIFVKPLSERVDKLQFLQAIRVDGLDPALTPAKHIEGVALAMQNLLIDSEGRIVPSPLIQDVQIRRFTHDEKGKVIKTDLREYELSRKALLTNPLGDGFSELDEGSEVFAPSSGNDYDFASAFPLDYRGNPSYIVKMRQRCADCHGTDQSFLIALQVRESLPGLQKPPEHYEILDPMANERAAVVIREKVKREDFKSLQRIYLERAGADGAPPPSTQPLCASPQS